MKLQLKPIHKQITHLRDPNPGKKMSNSRILAVLVLYKRAPDESESFTSLRNILQKRPELAATMNLLVYDNSPEAHTLPQMPMATRYVSNPANPGLAEAYNSGLRLANEEGIEWLLLLDHDTLLTEAYVEELKNTISTLTEMEPAACIIVPKLVYSHRGRRAVHSPHFMPRLTHHGVDLDFSGIVGDELSGFNSAATLRVRNLEALGGFPIHYSMEFLDHVVFHTLQKAGGKIWVMNSLLEHNLSTTNLEKNVSLFRYKKILYAERDFHMQMGAIDRIWYRLRRFKQGLGHLAKTKDKRYAAWDLRAALGALGKNPS
jgi:GT2 family glycosyltransferase